MELSGLIFVALALVWAVVLLPKALRHHDELAQTRSVERVSESMRVIARREAVSGREARLIIPAPAAPPTAPAVATAVAPGAAPVAAPKAAPVGEAPTSAARVRARIAAQRKAANAAARRRRFILAAVLIAGLGVALAATLGQLPLWSIGAPATVLVAFLVSARLLVRRERARWDEELRTLRARIAESSEDPASTDADPDRPVAPEVPAPATVEDEDVAPTADAGSLWDPLPVTLPTYVSKPRATRSVRTIDLNAPGVSSSGHDAASSALVADAATSAPPDDLPQRAVGT